MRAESLNKTNTVPDKAQVSSALLPSQRLLLLALNFIPLLQLMSVLGMFFIPNLNWIARIVASAIALYILPALFVRLLLTSNKIKEGNIHVGSKDFFVWWTTLQFQIIFCRFPALEELLRLVPGVYSMWLRLWGAKIGRLTYWSPGTLILDRSFLNIGNDVVFGAGVRLNAHVLTKNEQGDLELLLATIKIGERASIGGYSLLTAGTEIVDGETTRSFLLSPPFSIWENGKRVRDDKTNDYTK